MHATRCVRMSRENSMLRTPSRERRSGSRRLRLTKADFELELNFQNVPKGAGLETLRNRGNDRSRSRETGQNFFDDAEEFSKIRFPWSASPLKFAVQGTRTSALVAQTSKFKQLSSLPGLSPLFCLTFRGRTISSLLSSAGKLLANSLHSRRTTRA